MSDDFERYSDPQDATVALYLMNNDGGELTACWSLRSKTRSGFSKRNGRAGRCIEDCR